LHWKVKGSIFSSVKHKASITLSDSVLKALDRRAAGYKSRSELIEAAISAYLDHLDREELAARDLEIIDRNAERLNREAEDVLRYQVRI